MTNGEGWTENPETPQQNWSQPQAPQQNWNQGPGQVMPPQQAYKPKPSISAQGLLSSPKKLMTFGIVILVVGLMIAGLANIFEEPDSADYDFTDPDEADEYADDVESYQDRCRLTNGFGTEIMYLGLLMYAFGLIPMALTKEALPPNVRMGMFVSLGLMIGAVLW